MMKILKASTDFIGGLFLIIGGVFFLLLYPCTYRLADNWLIKTCLIIFLLGLGTCGVIFGVRRIFLQARLLVQPDQNKDKEQT